MIEGSFSFSQFFGFMQNVRLRGQRSGLFGGRFHRAGGQLDGLLGVSHSKLQEGFTFAAQVTDLGVFGLGLFEIVGLQGQIHAGLGQTAFESADGGGEGTLGIGFGFLDVSGFFLFLFRLGLGFRAGLGFTFALTGQERFHFSE